MGKWASSIRRRLAVVITVVGAVLALGLGTAAATGSRVVSPGGRVAGTGYAFWLKWQWQFQFAHTPPYTACRTVKVNGHKVGYLGIKSITPATTKYTCSEPAGRPLYFIELSAECSTFHGDHLTYGTSDSQLVKCARAEFKGGSPTIRTSIDGRAVKVMKLVAATRAYPVHNAKGNFVKSMKRRGRSAAYGPGLLLTGLSKGTHVIHSVAKITQPVNARWEYTWTVKVH
jgi:hypothetical protein